MTICNVCSEEFNEREEAEQHFTEQHADLVDECLQEYISDAEKDAFEQYLADEK